MIKRILQFILLGLSAVALAWGIAIGYINMDMTDTRLMVTYWKEFLMTIAIFAVTYYAWK